MTLTDNQRTALNFIQQYTATHSISPKLQEIAEGIGINSRGVAHRYAQALVDAGFVSIDKGKHRGIRVLKQNTPQQESTLPLLGNIAAGKPIEAIPGEDEINLTEFIDCMNPPPPPPGPSERTNDTSLSIATTSELAGSWLITVPIGPVGSY